jgi:hypothetical protein
VYYNFYIVFRNEVSLRVQTCASFGRWGRGTNQIRWPTLAADCATCLVERDLEVRKKDFFIEALAKTTLRLVPAGSGRSQTTPLPGESSTRAYYVFCSYKFFYTVCKASSSILEGFCIVVPRHGQKPIAFYHRFNLTRYLRVASNGNSAVPAIPLRKI